MNLWLVIFLLAHLLNFRLTDIDDSFAFIIKYQKWSDFSKKAIKYKLFLELILLHLVNQGLNRTDLFISMSEIEVDF